MTLNVLNFSTSYFSLFHFPLFIWALIWAYLSLKLSSFCSGRVVHNYPMKYQNKQRPVKWWAINCCLFFSLFVSCFCELNKKKTSSSAIFNCNIPFSHLTLLSFQETGWMWFGECSEITNNPCLERVVEWLSTRAVHIFFISPFLSVRKSFRLLTSSKTVLCMHYEMILKK